MCFRVVDRRSTVASEASTEPVALDLGEVSHQTGEAQDARLDGCGGGLLVGEADGLQLDRVARVLEEADEDRTLVAGPRRVDAIGWLALNHGTGSRRSGRSWRTPRRADA